MEMDVDGTQRLLTILKEEELKRAVSPTYMTRQTDINAKMREILIDWMVEVHHKFRLNPITLSSAVSILDHFVERRLVSRTKLQLVGCVALWLASKYHERYAPECNDFVAMSNKACTREQLLAMESIMLTAINYRLPTATSGTFVPYFCKLAGIELESNDQMFCLVSYLQELTLQSYPCLQFTPSHIAAGAVYLALSLCPQTKDHPWSEKIASAIGYKAQELKPVIAQMYKLWHDQGTGEAKYKAVKKKYSLAMYSAVAKYVDVKPALLEEEEDEAIVATVDIKSKTCQEVAIAS